MEIWRSGVATYTDSNNVLHTSASILAADLTTIANYYRQWFTLSWSGPASNSRITANDFNTLRAAIINGAGSAWTVSIPGAVSPNDRITATAWNAPTANFRSTDYNYTSPGTWSMTVPYGARTLIVHQAIGAGGGGGYCGRSDGDRGGDGCTGGYITNTSYDVSAYNGQSMTIYVGAGGASGDRNNQRLAGLPGGDTKVIMGSTVIFNAGGGPGGNYGTDDYSGSAPSGYDKTPITINNYDYGDCGSGAMYSSEDDPDTGNYDEVDDPPSDGMNGYLTFTMTP